MTEDILASLGQFADIVVAFETRLKQNTLPLSDDIFQIPLKSPKQSHVCPVCNKLSKYLGQFYGARQAVCRRCKEYFQLIIAVFVRKTVS